MTTSRLEGNRKWCPRQDSQIFQIIAAFSGLLTLPKKFAHSRLYTVYTLSTFSTLLCLSCDRHSWRVLDNSSLRQFALIRKTIHAQSAST